MTGRERIEYERKLHPSVAITVNQHLDQLYKWDGYGPDPEKDGYRPYFIVVKAMMIHDGKLLTGKDSIGGSYYRDNEPIGEANGYLHDLVYMALTDLKLKLLEYVP